MGEYLATQQAIREATVLLRRLDEHLGLAVHSGEGCDRWWLNEAADLITSIRQWTGDDER